MATVIPADRQSLLDIAVQTSGSIEAVIALAYKNGVSITDQLPIGIKLETVGVVDKTVVERYVVKKIRPATALSNGENVSPETSGGIGYMAVEIDFIVS